MTNTTPINASAVEEMEKEITKIISDFDTDEWIKGDNTLLKERLMGVFTTHHRQALERVVKKVEGLKTTYTPGKPFCISCRKGADDYRNEGVGDALAIIREEI